MPIKRRLITIGDSRGITIPKSWLELIEENTGTKLEEVAMEVNSVLTIFPVIEGKPVKVEINTSALKEIEEKEKDK